MRLGQLFSSGLFISSLLLSATGCISIDGRNACGPRGCSTGACQTGCSTCGDATYAGGPLARLIGFEGAGGCNSCGAGKLSGAGCGELYVDEWLNEPPTVDNCGCGECQTCGRQPIRSLLSTLWGETYSGSCETGCDSGVDFSSPIVNDGYDPNAWSANRGCNCRGNTSSMTQVHHDGMESHQIQPSEESDALELTPSPPSPVPHGTSTGKVPTPAPPAPKSANRLNPATRRIVR